MKLLTTICLMLALSGCTAIGNYAEKRDAKKVLDHTMSDPCYQDITIPCAGEPVRPNDACEDDDYAYGAATPDPCDYRLQDQSK